MTEPEPEYLARRVLAPMHMATVQPDEPEPEHLDHRVLAPMHMATVQPAEPEPEHLDHRVLAPMHMAVVHPAGPDPNDFETALAAVTGTKVELRAAARPAGGWLTTAPPGDGHWWTFSAFGTDLFSVDLNETACDAWKTAIGKIEAIDHELFSGRHGVMDLQRLRDAQAMVGKLSATLTDALGELKSILAPLEAGNTVLAGTAVSVLMDALHAISDVMNANRLELTERPSPAVAEVLDDAAVALTTYARQMAYIYWESNQVLLNAVTIGVNGITRNITAYLQAVGLFPGSQQYQALSADRTAGVEYARLMLGRYSSTVAGQLPNGMAPISGDLSQGAVWTAANAAISQLINVELDKLDVVARTVTAGLKTAYQNAATRLRAEGVMFPVQPAMSAQALALNSPAT